VQKVLNQEEIDAMFRGTRKAGASGNGEDSARVKIWDFRQVGQISREQLHSISSLHEAFARNLTNSLGAYLRVVFETNLVSVEQLTYREFLARVPDVSYLATLRMHGANAAAAFQMDLALAFPIVDLLLGGSGSPKSQLRQVTEIEDQILADVVNLICRELEAAWRPLGVTFELDRSQPANQIERLMAPGEKTLGLSFEIRMPESQGTLSFAIPAAVSNALLRKISTEWGDRQVSRETHSERIRPRLLQARFKAELALPSMAIPVCDLLTLRPGKVLRLPRAVNAPPYLLIAGQPLFSAAAVRAGTRCAAQVLKRISMPSANGSEAQ
jgi:flagellar motor switch protein FliM